MAGWKRALADYDNLKKDLSRERVEMRKIAAWQASQSFIAVLDNFDQAVRHVPDGLDDKMKGWVNGVLFIRIQLENTLRDLGPEPFGAVGEAFDPRLHEIVAERKEPENAATPSAKGEAGGGLSQVVEVISRGWKIGERIIRPAKVIVSS